MERNGTMAKKKNAILGDQNELRSRLAQIITNEGLSVTALSKETGLTYQTLTKFMEGENELWMKSLAKIRRFVELKELDK